MTTVSIQEASAQLPELIRGLSAGNEVLIVERDQPVARLIPAQSAAHQRELGTMRGSVLYMAPDFDAELDDFREALQ